MAVRDQRVSMQEAQIRFQEQKKAVRRNLLRRAVIDNLAGYLWIVPAFVIFVIFVVVPVWNGLMYSFEYVDLINPPKWIGLANFRSVFSDPLFWTAWRNSVLFMIYGLLIGYLVPVILAIIVNEMRIGNAFFRLIFYLPSLVPPAAAAFLWRWIYDPTFGLANTVLGFFHLPPLQFLNSPAQALPSLVFYSTWAGFGGGILFYIAALRVVPPELYDAAEVDGASIWQRVWHVTLPNIRFFMLITLIQQIIATVQVFNEPYLFTGGGPVNSTTTVVMLIYNYAFQQSDYGAASALSLTMFVVLVGFSLYYFYLMRRQLGLTRERIG